MKQTTAQDGSGSTIAPWDDLWVDLFSMWLRPRLVRPVSDRQLGAWSNHPKTRTDEEAVDAAGAMDAQNAPTAPWKTADGFPQAPTAILCSWDQRRIIKQASNPARDQPTTITEFRCGRQRRSIC